MFKPFIELIVGNLEDKRNYRKLKKRINALPKDYCIAFKKMQHYLYYVDLSGCDMKMYTDLIELFEDSAAHGKPILEVVGSDAAAFCEDFVRASANHNATTKDKLNREILAHFHKEVNES